jgi:hypothetical protein
MVKGKALSSVWRSQDYDWSKGWTWNPKDIDLEVGGKGGFFSTDFRAQEGQYIAKAASAAAEFIALNSRAPGPGKLKIAFVKMTMDWWLLEGTITDKGKVVGCFQTYVTIPHTPDVKVSDQLAQEWLRQALIADLYLQGGPTATAGDYKTVAGRWYFLGHRNPEGVNEKTQDQAAMDAKNGFRKYQFGMTLESFIATADANGDKVQEKTTPIMAGEGLQNYESLRASAIGDVPVEVGYVFYKNRLAKIEVVPQGDLTQGKGIRSIYDTIAQSYGPGAVKKTNGNVPYPELGDGSTKQSIESAIISSYQSYKNNGLKIGERALLLSRQDLSPYETAKTNDYRLGFLVTGALWHSEKIDIEITAFNDFFEDAALRGTGANAGGGSGVLEITSREVLGERTAQSEEARKRNSGI